jgi:hypothetical protein
MDTKLPCVRIKSMLMSIPRLSAALWTRAHPHPLLAGLLPGSPPAL